MHVGRVVREQRSRHLSSWTATPTTSNPLVNGLALSLQAVLSVLSRSLTTAGNFHLEEPSPARGQYQSCYMMMMTMMRMICWGVIRPPSLLLGLESLITPNLKEPTAALVTMARRIPLLVISVALALVCRPPSAGVLEKSQVEGVGETD